MACSRTVSRSARRSSIPGHRSTVSARMRSSRGLRACRVTTSTPTPRSSSRSWTNATWSRREAPGSKSTSKSRSLSGRDSPWRLNQTRQSDEPRASAPRERFPRGGGAIPLWSARHPSPPKDTAACLGGASDRDTTSRRTPCLLALRVAGAVRVAPLKACQVRAERAASRRTDAARDTWRTSMRAGSSARPCRA